MAFHARRAGALNSSPGNSQQLADESAACAISARRARLRSPRARGAISALAAAQRQQPGRLRALSFFLTRSLSRRALRRAAYIIISRRFPGTPPSPYYAPCVDDISARARDSLLPPFQHRHRSFGISLRAYMEERRRPAHARRRSFHALDAKIHTRFYGRSRRLRERGGICSSVVELGPRQKRTARSHIDAARHFLSAESGLLGILALATLIYRPFYFRYRRH